MGSGFEELFMIKESPILIPLDGKRLVKQNLLKTGIPFFSAKTRQKFINENMFIVNYL